MPLSIRVPTAADEAALVAAFAKIADPAALATATRLLRADRQEAPALAAFDGQDRMLALLVARVVPWLVRGEERRVGAIAGAWITETARIGGAHCLAVDLFEEFHATWQANGGIALLLARAGEWDSWWLQRYAQFDMLGTGYVLRRAGRGPVHAPPDWTVTRWTSDSPLDWSTPIATTPCTQKRDRAWAERLLRLDPDVEIHVAAQNGKVGGAAVHRDGNGERRLLDWAVPPGQWHMALALLQRVVGDGATPVVFPLWNASYWTTGSLQDADFVVDQAGGEPILVGRTDIGFLTRHFLAEHHEENELLIGPQLPDFTCSEVVCYPAQRGTR